MIVRQAVPAEDMMQAFIYHHLVPSQNLLVAVTGHERFWDPWKLISEMPVKVPVGGTVSVRFSPAGPLLDKVQLTFAIRRGNLAARRVAGLGHAALLLRADAEKVKPGLKGNLIIDASVEWTASPRTEKRGPIRGSYRWAVCPPYRLKSLHNATRWLTPSVRRSDAPIVAGTNFTSCFSASAAKSSIICRIV